MKSWVLYKAIVSLVCVFLSSPAFAFNIVCNDVSFDECLKVLGGVYRKDIVTNKKDLGLKVRANFNEDSPVDALKRILNDLDIQNYTISDDSTSGVIFLTFLSGNDFSKTDFAKGPNNSESRPNSLPDSQQIKEARVAFARWNPSDLAIHMPGTKEGETITYRMLKEAKDKSEGLPPCEGFFLNGSSPEEGVSYAAIAKNKDSLKHYTPEESLQRIKMLEKISSGNNTKP